ncbi:hypothetical protein RYX36_018597, partial [Vicia faba]
MGKEMQRVLEFYSGIGGMCFVSEILADESSSRSVSLYIHELWLDGYIWNFVELHVNVIDHGNIQSLTTADLDKYGAHAWLLSPPCQPYTRQGDFFFFSFYDNLFSPVSKMSLNNFVLGLQKGTGDARAFSFLQILELIPFLLWPPSMLFVENVVGFETSDTHAKLIEILEKTNFITQEFILIPLQFGVPYSRPRYFCLAKRKPSSFGNEFLSRQLIQSPKPLFYPFNAYAKEYDLSLEDRHNLFQSCQPIEKFLVLKNLSNDTNVEPEASVTGVSNDISRTSGEDNEDEYDSLDKYYIHPSLLERWGSAMDVVYPDSKRCCCFTKSYYRYVKGTGSLLATIQ